MLNVSTNVFTTNQLTDEDDDTDWLRYWTIGGIYFVLTEWVDNVLPSAQADVYWYKIATFFTFWLYYPRTNGSLFIDEYVTQKYLAPRLRPVQTKITNFISDIIALSANITHLYLVWIFFVFLPSGFKRVVAVAVGTVYPFLSSVNAITTEELEDDAYWLTYWACYGILFISMDLLYVKHKTVILDENVQHYFIALSTFQPFILYILFTLSKQTGKLGWDGFRGFTLSSSPPKSI